MAGVRTQAAAAAAEPVEGMWALPADWQWVRLGQVASTVGGGRLKLNKSHYVSSGFPAFSASGQDGYVEHGEFDGEAVVLSSIGARCGKCFFASGKWTSLANTQCIFPGDTIDARFLWHYLNDEERWERSGLAQPFIKPSSIHTLLTPLPPLEAQLRIASRIDELFADLDDGEAALRRVQADLGLWRKALLKAAVTGELTADWRAANPPTETGADLLARILTERRTRWLAEPRNKGKRYVEPEKPDSGDLQELPDGWTWASMEQLSWASGYGTSEKCAPGGGGTLVLRIPNIQGGRIDLGDLKRTAAPLDLGRDKALQIGDLLIIRTNGSEDLIGRAALVVEPPAEATYFASYLIRFRLLGPPKLLSWLAVLVDSPMFRSAVLRSIGSSAGQYNLNLTKIEGFALPIPPVSEIDVAIASFQSAAVSAVDGEAFAMAAEADAAILRQSILAAAFRGELTA